MIEEGDKIYKTVNWLGLSNNQEQIRVKVPIHWFWDIVRI